MRKISEQEDGVSEIVGEMLLLAIVLVLLAVFSSSLSNYLPPPRDPSVTIRMSPLQGDNVTLYHKGGDAIKTSDLTVIVEEGGVLQRLKPGNGMNVSGYSGEPNPNLFDLGDWIDVSGVDKDDTVSLTNSRAIIYSGQVQRP
jgi:archaeal type IV pilus assembly protein PilA